MRYPVRRRNPNGEGKAVQPAAHMSARIAVLKPSRQHLIERCPGDHSELAELRDCSRESPVRYPNSHAPLNDRRMLAHCRSMIVRRITVNARQPQVSPNRVSVAVTPITAGCDIKVAVAGIGHPFPYP